MGALWHEARGDAGCGGWKVTLPKLSAIATFHKEGVLAHATLRSYAKSREVARANGLEVEFVLVLDCADSVTRDFVQRHPDLDGSEKLIEISVGDPALSRNAGIMAATAPYICTLDGDDLISTRYFLSHMQEALRLEGRFVLHPEIVLSFGMYSAFNWQVDQTGQYFDRNSLLSINPWISAAFAHRSIYEEVPFVACYPSTTGFGYEDWYWNCEAVSKGVVHRLAWGTVYFYRRKWIGSRNEISNALKTVIPKTSLFDFAVNDAKEGSA